MTDLPHDLPDLAEFDDLAHRRFGHGIADCTLADLELIEADLEAGVVAAVAEHDQAAAAVREARR